MFETKVWKHMNTGKLSGKNALITGASRGLGRAMAVALGEAKATVALVSRDKDQMDTTAQAVRAAGGTAHTFKADVTDEQQVLRLAGAVEEEFGKIQILINNAGINVRKPVTDFTLEEWRRVLDTNLTGAFLMCRSFVPLMRGQGYGRIINMTSIMSHVSMAHRSAYSASKAGLLGFTRALALELAPDAITVNGISPSPIATEMNLPITQNPELNRQFISRIPLGRWGKVEEIGQLALYLCANEAGFITGADLLIDGGWCAQ
jgi:NAD(P)-dependent dehydrogenase (short-subunit alcohol dehydrogenase family)